MKGWFILAQDGSPLGPYDSREAAAAAEQELAARNSMEYMLLGQDEKASVRSYDADGRMHIELTNISKANVCPYYGDEIPDADALGLDKQRKYMLWRHPDELQKAAPTFDRLPILSEHQPVNVKDHKPDLIVGATGSDSVFEAPYLKNSLVVWAKDAVNGVEKKKKRELSCAYRYRVDMTPGVTPDGMNYDGIMCDIIGNHVALVEEGRAGPDVMVGDSKPNEKEIDSMANRTERRAAVAKARAFLKDLQTSGKIAKDAKLDDIHKLMDSLDKENAPKPTDDPSAAAPMPAKPSREFLSGKLSAEDLASYDKMCSDETAEEPKDEGEEEMRGASPEKKETLVGDEEEKVDKKAMDAAIAVASKQAEDRAIKRAAAIREAEKAVRPYVGELAMAHDSAESVYRTALGVLGVDASEMAELPLPALKAVLKAQPVPGAKKDESVAMDSAPADEKGTLTRFPNAGRVKRL